MTEPNDKSRRGFLGVAAVGAAGLGVAAIAPGFHLIEVSQAGAPGAGVSNKVRWGMLIDTTKCASDCNACVKACNTENGITETVKDPRQGSQWIRKLDLKDPKSGLTHSLPMLCQHCEHPPCVDVCPTGASMKRADGIVLVDRHTCIGCRYCMLACPYKARSFVHIPLTEQNPEVPRGQGCVESCTFCVQRVDKGQIPACVEACANAEHNAMLFGDLNDPNSEIAQRVAQVKTTQVRADLKLNVGVRYQGI
ncbi:MAG: 4Fe-4S dicluster domain-containing protein [Gammaproteobacteria bacterium]|nr:4Fe-4S dicluster domain-containing protein [Rhodocyclaceae bacterium]MBU3909761.1 4Fe-4S dicluster domain-containing protein [Gammaproteobacteria bacterium]MBU3990675.1 4Fe-4S dicluster domain-containing protein [Gammaproteobacteria bacterium]MBU4005294.1 4Fe-4S dicluster domain-containing protein [Gammaproteobacteria bacterium]MBU4022472.1 4Fe-4S dicluster domain-containing protein [Gammaproteobacteria bacterium]